MAMMILNNPTAVLTLGELNKNISKQGENMKKLSSGMRINGAKDDASGYAISEKMRVMIRGLDQDEQNVRNGSSLVKVASGGIENIIDELRGLKELALNAANDSNTDADRATIQKVFNQKKANIDDIASTTNYNGIPLLDGRWKRPGSHVEFRPVEPNRYNNALDDDGVSVNTVSGLFANSGFTEAVADPENGKTVSSGVSWLNGRNVLEGNAYNPYRLDFSSVAYSGNLADAMNGQGFYVVCAGNSSTGVTNSHYDWCEKCHSFVFDANLDVGTGRLGIATNEGEIADTYGRRSIAIGIKGIDDPANLAKAFFEGVRAVVSPGSEAKVVKVPSGTDVLTFRENEDGTYTMERNYGIWVYEGFPMQETDTDPTPDPPPDRETELVVDDYRPLVIQHGTRSNQAINLFINDMHIKSLKSELPAERDVERLEKYLPASSAVSYQEAVHRSNSVTPEEKMGILDGIVERLALADPQYARSSNYRNYMEFRATIAAAREAMTLDKADVTTQRNANVTIRVVDGALEYALNEATHMGAYIQRLEFTEANITLSNENTQASESTIRDADMAREMLEYTKNNVLSQASQSMLAQANQNLSSVLSLLQ